MALNANCQKLTRLDIDSLTITLKVHPQSGPFHWVIWSMKPWLCIIVHVFNTCPYQNQRGIQQIHKKEFERCVAKNSLNNRVYYSMCNSTWTILQLCNTNMVWCTSKIALHLMSYWKLHQISNTHTHSCLPTYNKGHHISKWTAMHNICMHIIVVPCWATSSVKSTLDILLAYG